jgi:phosphoglycerate dehydrogenase-like enzyme
MRSWSGRIIVLRQPGTQHMSAYKAPAGAWPVVMLTNPIHPAPHGVLAQHAEVRTAPSTDPETLSRCATDADVIIVRAPLPPEAGGAQRLRGVVRHGAGLDMIPIETASRLGIAVANVPKVNALSVAEYAIGQMPHVILSAHLAGISQDSVRRRGRGAVEQTLWLLNGELHIHFVNTEAAAAIRTRIASLDSA